MIPIELTLSGFLSYRQQTALDFTAFDLACISGANGAGKSSLLDAITWVLFGQARKRDDSLINSQCDQAQVSLIFFYEGNLYQVIRTSPRGKTSQLEFQIYQGPVESASPPDLHGPGRWKTLSERTLRSTQDRIEQTLRLDYDTFVNASFFLQGKADQFAQQRPGDRKKVLASILGLEIWETYRQQAAERRKNLEAEISACDGRLAEIEGEINEGPARLARLKGLENELEILESQRKSQETSLEQARRVAAALAEQSRLLDALGRQFQTTRRQLEEQQTRLDQRRQEQQEFNNLLAQAGEIERAYQAWQKARSDIEYWDEIAARFHEQQSLRQEPLRQIQVAKARLEQDLLRFKEQQAAATSLQADLQQLQVRLEQRGLELVSVEDKLQRRAQLEIQLQNARQRQVEIRSENPRLRQEMDALRLRIDQLSQTEGAACPLCGQPLAQHDRSHLLESWQEEGTQLGDRYRANSAEMRAADELVSDLENQIRSLAPADNERVKLVGEISRLRAQSEQTETGLADWRTSGEPGLLELERRLSQEDYAMEARSSLAAIDSDLKTIGYDPQAHLQARSDELSGRSADSELRRLERARAALALLEREIVELQDHVSRQEAEARQQQQEFDQAAAALAAAQAQAPDLLVVEQELLRVQQRENQCRMEVGAARQQVLVLDDLKQRRKSLQAERERLSRQIAYYRQLEKAFGKDGVPALLIEQALPQIEARANEILDRLSAGGMSVRFITQQAYKDRRRDDLRETLDIQISDGAGTRDYEMFSGGEAFRVNFAVRLALSEVLAQRAGARLQTLVVDEGFGSQDTQGRQRLIEAINLVRPDFAKIIVITHIDELKDAFPNRIEVEKTELGSRLRVI